MKFLFKKVFTVVHNLELSGKKGQRGLF